MTGDAVEQEAASGGGAEAPAEGSKLKGVRLISELLAAQPSPLELLPRVYREAEGGLLLHENITPFLDWHVYLRDLFSVLWGEKVALTVEQTFELAPKVQTFLCRGVQLTNWLQEDVDSLVSSAEHWHPTLSVRLTVARALEDPNGLHGVNALQLRNFLRAENWEGLRLLIVDCVHDVKGLADAHLPHRVNTARGLFVSCYAQHHRYTEP